MSDTLLFCLPYAGASASVYSKWKGLMDNSVKIVAVELAGKGKRFRERQYNSVTDATEDIFNVISNQIKENSSYALFGHSMGALLSYHLYYRIVQDGLPLPKHLFLSGHAPPHIKPKTIYHILPDEEFIDEIRKLGGTKNEFFENQELLSLFIPILREDYRILEEYKHEEKPEKIISDVTIFHGTDDEMTFDEMKEWEKYVKNRYSFHTFKGGHFFIHDYTEDIVKIIQNHLCGSFLSLT